MRNTQRVEHLLVVATDMQDLRHLAQLAVVTEKQDGRYTSVIVSTACIPSTTNADMYALTVQPFALPVIHHKGLTLMTYQRVGLATPPATCIVCAARAEHTHL